MPSSESPAAPDAPRERAIEIGLPAEPASAAVAKAAEIWGAEIEPREGPPEAPGAPDIRRFRLRLAVAAGLRRGWMTGELAVEPAATGGGSRVVFRPEESQYRVQTAAVGILVLAALGAIAATLWPVYPALLPLAPIGIVLGLCAWFLVLSRLHTSGPEEFLETVAEAAAETGTEDASDGEEGKSAGL